MIMLIVHGVIRIMILWIVYGVIRIMIMLIVETWLLHTLTYTSKLTVMGG